MTQRDHAKLIDAAWERGAHWERLRIRRAQREALRELQAFETATVWTDVVQAIGRRLDNATRAPRPVGRKRTK